MTEYWVISDTHFDHANVLNFRGLDGNLIRPKFQSSLEMDETMIHNWNSVVKPHDKIYHLGDFSFGNNLKKQRISEYSISIMKRLNGKKRLILGNHDLTATEYHPYFEDIRSWKELDHNMFGMRMILTHAPLHESSFAYKQAINVHGHIHEKSVGDVRFCNVSVERTGFKPVRLEDIARGLFSDETAMASMASF